MRLVSFYRKLLARYGKQGWWPARSPFEVVIGAVLTQNTNWGNVEKAISNLKKAGMLTPERILEADTQMLERAVRPSGFYRQKTKTLKRVAGFFSGFDFGSFPRDDRAAEELRERLLAIKGVGKETTDSILLYALDLPVFVVDAYTIRFCGRHGILNGVRRDKRDYEKYRAFFERNLPGDAEVYNEFHALIVRLAKDRCTKNSPGCGGCPIGQDSKASRAA